MVKAKISVVKQTKKTYRIPRSGWSDLGQKWVNLAQMGQIRGFFRSNFSTFWLDELNLTHFRPKYVIPVLDEAIKREVRD